MANQQSAKILREETAQWASLAKRLGMEQPTRPETGDMVIRADIAIVGAGIGGLALAGLLSRRGGKVRVYEQAKEFQRIGAGIQMSPNAMRVLAALDLEGIEVSTGSACTTGSAEPSHVLLAMGLDPELAHGSLRVTVGRATTEDEVGRATTAVRRVVERLRGARTEASTAVAGA